MGTEIAFEEFLGLGEVLVTDVFNDVVFVDEASEAVGTCLTVKFQILSQGRVLSKEFFKFLP